VSELVHLEVVHGSAVITLDSPSNRNALSAQLVSELARRIETAAGDPGIRSVTITATGTVFCSGADLKSGGIAATAGFPGVLRAVLECPKPVVAKLNGRARAGGLGLIAACDVAIAPDTADFAFAEVRLGLVPAMIAVTCVRCMAPRAVRRYMLTGEVFSAAEAAAAGLLTMAVPGDEVDAVASAMTDAFRQCGPGALATTKGLLRDVPSMAVSEGLARMAELSARTFGSAEAAEGVRAFADKRPPAWAE
jgi:methylglutaconyl-CoA hydratase